MIAFVSLVFSFLFFMALVIVLQSIIKKRKEVSDRIQMYAGYQPTVVKKASPVQALIGKIHEAFARRVRETGPERKVNRWDLLMGRADLPLLGSEFLAISAGAAVLIFVIAFAFLRDPGRAFISAVLFLAFDYIYVHRRVTKRLNTFQNQLADCLTLVANSLRAGFSFLQTMEIVAHEMQPPMSSEFDRVMRDTRLGRTMEDALRSMDDRVGSPDFSLVVTAVLIQQQVGGNLANILDTIRNTIMERIRIRREIGTLTAQGRMSGIVLACIPVALALFFYITSPEYLEPLLNTNIGKILIAAALVLEIIGFVIIYKIVDIKV